MTKSEIKKQLNSYTKKQLVEALSNWQYYEREKLKIFWKEQTKKWVKK